MSVQAGIWNLDGRPVDRTLLESYSRGLAEYGPDGESTFFDGPIAMLHRALHRTEESRLEKQPVITPQGNVIVWEGRLDNRDELAAQLAERPSTLLRDSDVVAATFDRWGENSFARIKGDWALSAWNQRNRVLTLTVDRMAIKHLYYWIRDDAAVWCSDLKTLILANGGPFELDEEFIAGYFAYYPTAGHTPYREIRTVQPGQVVQIRCGNVRQWTYWNFNPDARIRYRKDGEYEEHFRHVFRQAVRRTLHAADPILADLSGGLDSSSIVCMADDILARGECTAPRIDTYSHYDLGEPTRDDLHYVGIIERKRGRSGHHLNIAEHPNSLFPDYSGFLVAPGAVGNTFELRRSLEAIWHSGGYKVSLCGIGGDELTGGVPDPRCELADLLIQLKILKFARQTIAWSLVKRSPWIRIALRATALLLPAGIRSRVSQEAELAPWVDPHFAGRCRLSRRQLGSVDRFGYWLPSRQETARTVAGLGYTQGSHLNCTSGMVERRYPFLDQDFVEFVLAIPRDQVIRPGERRSLMRRALKGLVPDEVLARKTKAIVTRAPLVALANDWNEVERLLKYSALAQCGFVDQQKLREALMAAKAGDAPQMVRLVGAVLLDAWLRDVVRRGVLKIPGLPLEKEDVPSAPAQVQPPERLSELTM
ncbi:MAG TPA: asparagine synthase-related protein [Candidatus Angelobacter sp.]|nr:asparagine synthase-related protein [Candidatus Angelobacter sp.]